MFHHRLFCSYHLYGHLTPSSTFLWFIIKPHFFFNYTHLNLIILGITTSLLLRTKSHIHKIICGEVSRLMFLIDYVLLVEIEQIA